MSFVWSKNSLASIENILGRVQLFWDAQIFNEPTNCRRDIIVKLLKEIIHKIDEIIIKLES